MDLAGDRRAYSCRTRRRAAHWTNSHFHHFEISGEGCGDPELLDDDFDPFQGVDSTKTLLSEILPKNGNRFAFKYGDRFGDYVEHGVLFDGHRPIVPEAKYPLCLEGKLACPPVGCGGTSGYGDLLEVICNPKHEEHESLLEWIGGRFDSEAFDAIGDESDEEGAAGLEAYDIAMPKRKPNSDEANQHAVEEIVGLVDPFCREHLNENCNELSRRLTQKLARKRPSHLVSGEPNTWACGIVRTIGWGNFLDDPSQNPHRKSMAVNKGVGVGERTGTGKAMLIRKMLNIGPLDPDWTVASPMSVPTAGDEDNGGPDEVESFDSLILAALRAHRRRPQQCDDRPEKGQKSLRRRFLI